MNQLTSSPRRFPSTDGDNGTDEVNGREKKEKVSYYVLAEKSTMEWSYLHHHRLHCRAVPAIAISPKTYVIYFSNNVLLMMIFIDILPTHLSRSFSDDLCL